MFVRNKLEKQKQELENGELTKNNTSRSLCNNNNNNSNNRQSSFEELMTISLNGAIYKIVH